MTEQQEKYLEKFYEPDFSAYDFITLFSAANARKNDYYFDRDSLIQFINFCKRTSIFNNLLDDIMLKSNGVTYFSDELNNAITSLKMVRILYTISPENDGTIYISKNIPIEDLIEPRKNYFIKMNEFINAYKNFEEIKYKGNVFTLKK